MAIPSVNVAWTAQYLPFINGGADSYPYGGINWVHHGYHPAGWWDQEVSYFTRTLVAGTTVSYGYYVASSQPLSYWGYDQYTALEITRVN